MTFYRKMIGLPSKKLLHKKADQCVLPLTKSADSRRVDIYLCCPHKKKAAICRWLLQLVIKQQGEASYHHPIFLSMEDAYQYNRFLGNTHSIVNLSVPENVIVACNANLTLKTKYLHPHNFKGYFLDHDKLPKFYRNTQPARVEDPIVL